MQWMLPDVLDVEAIAQVWSFAELFQANLVLKAFPSIGNIFLSVVVDL